MSERKTTEQFIKDAKDVHGDKYNYSEVEYVNTTTKVKIFCKECNEYFWKRPINHIAGKQGCPECGKKERNRKHLSNTSEFIEKAKKIHGDKYDYSEVEYVNNKTPVKIICKEHKEFWMTPNGHLNGYGCKECGNISRKKKCSNHPNKRTLEQFIEDAKKIHGDKYDYSEVEYINDKTKVKINCFTCRESFWQKPNNHIGGKQGCPYCNGNPKKTQEKFLKEMEKIHGDNYDYSFVKYINDRTPVKIFCKKCNNFFNAAPSHLLQKHGCPYCNQSIGEKTIERFFKKTNIKTKRNKKFNDLKDINKLSYDFYIEEYNLLIEYNGIQHYKWAKRFQPVLHDFHKQLHHDWLKRKYANKNGFNYLVIPYWKKEKIEQILIAYICGLETKSA